MFKDVAHDSEEYPILARLAQAAEPGLWAEDPTRALLVMMRHAVAALPDETAEKCAESSTWRHLGRLLYFGSEVNGSLETYTDYVAAAEAYSGMPWSKSNFNRLTRPVRVKLADILLAMEQQALKAQEKTQAAAVAPASMLPSASTTPFIPRPSLDEQFNALWSTALTNARWKRPDVLCVVGEPGTGKTRYVKELLGTTGAVWIEAEPADALCASLGAALQTYGVPVSSLDTSARKHEFSKLLARTDGPTLVVVDGISDPEEIDAWLRRSTRARLIITSQTCPADSWSPILHVGEMKPSEATAMVTSLPPASGEREAGSLAASLGYRPIAIVQASAFIRSSPGWSITDLVSELARDTAMTLQSLPERSNVALTSLYEEIIKTLKEKHPASHKLLRLLAFVPPIYVPRKLVTGFLAGHLLIEENERKTLGLRYRSVTRPLRELCLLEESSSGIRLNSLTKKLLWDLIWPDLLVIIQEYNAATDGVDEFELDDLGWSPEEIASVGAIGMLSSTRTREVIATKAQPDEADQLLARRDRILTADEWSALTDALWERRYRVAIVEHLLKLEDGMTYDDILKWLQPYMDEADRITVQIPGRDAWLDRTNAFDWLSFMEWINKDESTKREELLAGLKEHSLGEFVLQVRIYGFVRTIWMHLADPIVETRLGQFDLRELYPTKNEPEDHDQPFALTNPRVVLALESAGATCHAPLVLRVLGYSDASELLRVIDLNDDRQSLLRPLAGMTTAPLVSEKLPSTPISWRLSKPFTPLIIVVSPKGSFATFEMVEEVRSQLLADTSLFLHRQGVAHPNPDDLNELVNIRVWQESCYEFEHFTDEELADGIITSHQDIDGWSREELVGALSYWRAERQDIESVWMIGRWDERTGRMTGKWANEVNKSVLALFGLWPTLERKIKQLKAGAEIPTPPIVQVVNDAYQQAQRRRQPSFILTELPVSPDDT
jgi:hypothetical protein